MKTKHIMDSRGFHLYSINRPNGYAGRAMRSAIVYDRATDSLLEVTPTGFHTTTAAAIESHLKDADQTTPLTFEAK